jgi:hypothetical protein
MSALAWSQPILDKLAELQKLQRNIDYVKFQMPPGLILQTEASYRLKQMEEINFRVSMIELFQEQMQRAQSTEDIWEKERAIANYKASLPILRERMMQPYVPDPALARLAALVEARQQLVGDIQERQQRYNRKPMRFSTMSVDQVRQALDRWNYELSFCEARGDEDVEECQDMIAQLQQILSVKLGS